MRIIKTTFVLLSIIVLSLTFSTSTYADSITYISNVTGEVKLKKSKRRETLITPSGVVVTNNDKVIVGKGGSAIISYSDKSRVMLKENTVFVVREKKFSYLEKGRAFLRILKSYARKSKKKYKFSVGINDAVVGVKGTTFLIENVNGKASVYLKEGLIGVESMKGDFEKHSKKQKEDYDNYKKKVEGNFDDYKSTMEKDFVEYVKSFDLKPDQAISISGSVVKDKPFTDKIKSEFEEFEKKIAEME